MTPKLLATVIFLVGCYTGVGPASESATGADSVNSSSTIGSSADETGEAAKQTIELDGFADGTLVFQIPADWYTQPGDGFFTIASYPPPFAGMAGSMPAGIKVDVFDSVYERETSFEQEISLANKTWTKSIVPESGETAVYYTHDTWVITVVVSRDDGALGLAPEDIAVAEDIIASMEVQP